MVVVRGISPKVIYPMENPILFPLEISPPTPTLKSEVPVALNQLV